MPDNATFCSECGANLKNPSSKPKFSEKDWVNLIFALVWAIMGIGALIGLVRTLAELLDDMRYYPFGYTLDEMTVVKLIYYAIVFVVAAIGAKITERKIGQAYSSQKSESNDHRSANEPADNSRPPATHAPEPHFTDSAPPKKSGQDDKKGL